MLAIVIASAKMSKVRKCFKHSSDKKPNQQGEENRSRREAGTCFSLLQTTAGDTGELFDEQLLTPSGASLGAQW